MRALLFRNMFSGFDKIRIEHFQKLLAVVAFIASGFAQVPLKPKEIPEQVRLSEILVSLKGADELAKAQHKAEVILNEIRTGTSFAKEAKKYSKGPTAAEGGEAGYFKRGDLPKSIEDGV